HPSSDEIEQAELRLLKSAYRLDGDVHAALAGIAQVVAGTLGLDREVVLYHDLHDDQRNARVLRLGDVIHITFSGDLLDLLTVREQEAVLAHELAHAHLHERDDRAYSVLDHLVHRLDAEAPDAEPIGETARRLRLHTEVYADAIAFEISGDLRAVVSAIVKVSTGLRNVDPDAYLRQARQIVESDGSSSHGWTHPELHVRIACLAARATPAAQAVVGQLIDGPDDLDHIDLLGQLRLQRLAADVLAAGAAVAGTHAADVSAYVRNYPELALVAPGSGAATLSDGELVDCAPSVRFLAGALLVDLALSHAGPEAGLGGLQAFSDEASRLGVADEFDKILARAVERPVADVRSVRSMS
ncbi:MAG: hypothetical protein ABIO83_05795, partial [Ilumatobacteraceae bacterium]